MLLNAGNTVAPAAADLMAAQTRVDNDVEEVPLLLANTIQSQSANAPPSAAVLNQWNQTVSELAADVSVEWQAFVHYEFAVLQAYQQSIVQTYATLLADVDGDLIGHGLVSSSTSPVRGTAGGSTASEQGQAASDSLMSYSMTAPSLLQSPSQTLSPLLQHNGEQGGGGNGPLYVLDLNTGETIPANVTLNTFANWKEDLLAQVSGGAIASYSWNLTQAPDLNFVSGQNTANLQGTWAPNSGSKKDIISVTETPQVGQATTFTMTFEVASFTSPAYSSSRPTSSSTWPAVITPDQISSGQATQAAGPYASIGEADGGVQTSFSMPSYNPNTTPVSLDYNSVVANAQPIFLDEYQMPMGQTVPSSITAQLTFDNTALSTVTYNTSGLNAGDIVQIALQANATGLTTGRYPWSITVTNGTNQTTTSGNVDIVNQSSSPYGAGWTLDNVQQLFPVTGGVILVNPDGTSLWFASNGQGGYTTPAGDFSTLTLTNGVYTRTMPDGTTESSIGKDTFTRPRVSLLP